MDQVRSVLFGLEDFKVLDAIESDDGGVLEVWVETIDPVLGCPSCGGPAGLSRGRPVVKLRDVTSAGRQVTVWWRKQRRACPDLDCGRKSFTEQHQAVGARRRSTARCREHLAHQIGVQCRPVSALAAEVGVSWTTAMRATTEHAQVHLIGQMTTTTRWLGVDETAFRVPRRFTTNIADVETGVELDVFAGRSSLLLSDWLAAQPEWWRQGVEVVAMDGSGPFRRAVRDWLPNAQVVLDRFHALRWFHQVIDDVRRRTAWSSHGRRGRKCDPIWVNRRMLLRGFERLSDLQIERLFNSFTTDDPDGEIAWAYMVKELARQTWSQPSIGRWGHLLQHLANSDIPELERLGRTLDNWHDEIINSFNHHDVTNATTEGLNRKVKQVKRTACGFRNHHNYRTRVLMHCGNTGT